MAREAGVPLWLLCWSCLAWLAHAVDYTTCHDCVSQGKTYCMPDDDFGDSEGNCNRCYSDEEMREHLYNSCSDLCFGGTDYKSDLDCFFDAPHGWVTGVLVLALAGGTICSFCILCLGLPALRRYISSWTACLPCVPSVSTWSSQDRSRLSSSALASPMLPPGTTEVPVERWMKAPPYWTQQKLMDGFSVRYDIVDQSKIMIFEGLLRDTFLDLPVRDRRWGAMPTALHFMRAQRLEDSKRWCKFLKAKEILKKKRNTCTPMHRLSRSGPAKTMELVRTRSWKRMFFEDLDRDVNELYLWHATSPESALGLLDDGVDHLTPSPSNAGAMFGNGIYLAEACSKSDEFASSGRGAFQGVYALVLCRAVCGEMFLVENSDMVAIKKALSSGRYDSVLGDREPHPGAYRDFVLYHEDVVYPEYVILYTRTYLHA